MDITTLRCQNCGVDLPVPGDAEFVRCTYCRTAHQVDRGQDGSVNVVKLEAAVKKVGEDVQAVDQKTDRLLSIHRSMAEKDNAREDLRNLKSNYEAAVASWREGRNDREREYERDLAELLQQQKKPLAQAQAMTIAGILLLVLLGFLAVGLSNTPFGRDQAVRSTLTCAIPLLLIMTVAGILIVMSLRSKRTKLRDEFKADVKRLDDAKKNMEIAANEQAAKLQAIIDRRIEVE